MDTSRIGHLLLSFLCNALLALRSLDEEAVGDDQLETSVEHDPPPETLLRPRFRGGFRCLFASGLFSLLPLRRLLLHHRVSVAAAFLLVAARERAFLGVRASALPLSSSFQCDVECRPGKGRPRKKTSEKWEKRKTTHES